MAIAFRSSANTSYASRTNTVVTAPAGIANDDILVLHFALGSATAPPTPTIPAGFTQIDTVSATAGGFTVRALVAWKRAASESGSYTVTHTSCSSQALLSAYSGCVATGSPIDTYSKNAYVSGPTGQTTIATSITTGTANTQLIFAANDWQGGGALTPPTGFTERFDGLIYDADKAQAAAGATGNVTQTNANGVSDGWTAFLIALGSVAGSGGGGGGGGAQVGTGMPVNTVASGGIPVTEV